RHFGKMLSGLILGIGFIMIAFTEQKQGLHDQMAGTLVLMGEPQQDYPVPPNPPDFSYRGGPLNIG
ncbi:MAG TPA: RDD family protein, partial [Pyrinomonadaceae bacterium]|nr:RDD family protein [Pyrinomonadaceae bacterium]